MSKKTVDDAIKQLILYHGGIAIARHGDTGISKQEFKAELAQLLLEEAEDYPTGERVARGHVMTSAVPVSKIKAIFGVGEGDE